MAGMVHADVGAGTWVRTGGLARAGPRVREGARTGVGF